MGLSKNKAKKGEQTLQQETNYPAPAWTPTKERQDSKREGQVASTNTLQKIQSGTDMTFIRPSSEDKGQHATTKSAPPQSQRISRPERPRPAHRAKTQTCGGHRCQRRHAEQLLGGRRTEQPKCGDVPGACSKRHVKSGCTTAGTEQHRPDNVETSSATVTTSPAQTTQATMKAKNAANERQATKGTTTKLTANTGHQQRSDHWQAANQVHCASHLITCNVMHRGIRQHTKGT